MFECYYEKDFEKDFNKLFNTEENQMKNIFFKKRVKKLLFSNNDKERTKKNNSNYFSEFSEKGIISEGYYITFLELLNKFSNDSPEDIEISIYNNLKKENENRINVIKGIKELKKNLVNLHF